jgi:2-oxoglutarate ferredoxin oxidoreductase subunit delta
VVKKVNKKVHIYGDFCKGCGLCIFFCPDKALSAGKKFNTKGFHPAEWKGPCSLCGRCYIICPDFAIEVK